MKTVINNLLQDNANAGQLISPTRVLHEVISKEDAVKTYLQEYGTNVPDLVVALKELIDEKEAVNVVAGNRNMGGRRRAIPAEPLASLTAIMDKAEKLVLEKVGADAPVDFKTFLYVTIRHSNEETGDTDCLVAFQNAGFNFDKFMADFEKRTESIINELCTNFNELAKSGKIDPVIGREDEILRTIEVLCKRKKNNVVLLGKAGVGKTAIAEGIALAIVEKKVPVQLKDAVIYNLEIANMVAGTQFRGQFEQKMMDMIKEFKALEESGKMPILFIDEIHSIVGSGNSNGLDFANIIKPALSRGQLRCIGTTTDGEWQKFINSDKALKRRFAQVNVEEPTRLQTVEILKGAKKYYEEKHGVEYTDASIVRTVDLSMEFITETALPDKALDLFDLAGSIYKLKGEKVVDEGQIENAISRMKNVSLDAVRMKRVTTEVQPIAPKIKEFLFGQDHAVEQVVKVVERSLAGLQEDNKPIGQFLFVGPTGVGKTELAKLLAKEMKAHLERIDMSEYMEPHSIAKLIGAPPGYVGYDQQGRLNKAISKNPRCVLLFDEVEKAHPRVLDILLQAMDNAKITDSQGDEIRFNNTLILMTSNAGAREMNERKLGLVQESFESKKINTKALEEAFTPEFRNRLNGVVHFNSLPKDKMVSIVKKFVKSLNDTKLVNKGISLTLTPDAEQWIVDQTYDPNMGGRPIERGVQNNITEPITQSILYGEIKQGKKKVTVSVEDNKLKFIYE